MVNTMPKQLIRISLVLLLVTIACVSVTAETVTLTISASIDGSQVTLDDKKVGETPLVIQLESGNHKILITSKDGKEKLEKTFEAKAGERMVIFSDFKAKEISIFTSEAQIAEFITNAANLVKYEEYVKEAQEFYKEKKLDWALESLEKALTFNENKTTRDLLIKWRTERLPSNFVYLRGDKFMMGQKRTEYPDDYRHIPEHPVIVSDFAMAIYEVTNADFAAFVNDTNYRTLPEDAGSSPIWDEKKQQWEFVPGVSWKSPKGKNSNIKGKDDFPVCHITWVDADAYCRWRCAKEGFKPGSIRLPTEAEWEFAARGVEGRSFPWGDKKPWEDKSFAVIESKEWSKVGSKKAGKSPEGIFDQIGNVWEWCFDRGDSEYYQQCLDKGVVVDPMGPPTGPLRSLRGGGYDSDPDSARPTKRFFMLPETGSMNVGFRIVVVFY